MESFSSNFISLNGVELRIDISAKIEYSTQSNSDEWQLTKERKMAKKSDRAIAVATSSQDKLIKCPGCDVKLPERDLHAQIAHMDKYHPDIIAARRYDAEPFHTD